MCLMHPLLVSKSWGDSASSSPSYRDLAEILGQGALDSPLGTDPLGRAQKAWPQIHLLGGRGCSLGGENRCARRPLHTQRRCKWICKRGLAAGPGLQMDLQRGLAVGPGLQMDLQRGLACGSGCKSICKKVCFFTEKLCFFAYFGAPPQINANRFATRSRSRSVAANEFATRFCNQLVTANGSATRFSNRHIVANMYAHPVLQQARWANMATMPSNPQKGEHRGGAWGAWGGLGGLGEPGAPGGPRGAWGSLGELGVFGRSCIHPNAN